MKICGNDIHFGAEDMPFVARFGVEDATNMVFDFSSTNHHPFIYDTYQLAALLGINRRTLFSLYRNVDNAYREIKIPKRSGGVRVLYAPDDSLKRVQKRILDEILGHFPISPYATAYHRGAKLKDNAQPHTGKKYLLKMDLADFFGSIRFDQVYSSVFHSRRFPREVGVLLTALCCRKDALPQGACTSPALSNLVFRWFDDTFGAWCKKEGFSYTRYCDDITVSGNKPLYRAFQKAKGMLENMGFELNEKKTRFLTGAGRQEVTGLTVNEKVSIPSSYKRALRQELYYAVKFGLPDDVRREEMSAYQKFYQLLGKIAYVLSVEPENQYFRKMRDELYLSFYFYH